MVSGARLLGVALICLLLTGPIGPCGPSTPWGLITMLLAFACFIASLVVSFVSLIGGMGSRDTRARLLFPVVVATTLTASLGFVMKLSMGFRWADAAWTLFYVWLPTVAVVHTIRDRFQPAT